MNCTCNGSFFEPSPGCSPSACLCRLCLAGRCSWSQFSGSVGPFFGHSAKGLCPLPNSFFVTEFCFGLWSQVSAEEDRVVATATHTHRPRSVLHFPVHSTLYNLACLVLIACSVWANLMLSRLSHLLVISVDQVVERSREHQLPPDSSMERKRQPRSEHIDLLQKL